MIWAVLQGRMVGVRAGAKLWDSEGGALMVVSGRAGEAGDRKV